MLSSKTVNKVKSQLCSRSKLIKKTKNVFVILF